MQDELKKIDKIVKENKVVLFMKGNKDFPMCGFSAFVADLLKKNLVNFLDINVLESEELRAAIKEYSNWPTIPQLYIDGEFIGGSDIVRELYEAGELQKLLKI